MKNTLPLILMAALSGLPLSAATLTPDQALSRLYSEGPRKTIGIANPDNRRLSLKTTVGELYVFSAEKGFVILPSEDSAPALLAYSDSEDFDASGNPAVKYWMDFYNSQVSYLKEHPDAAKAMAVSHKKRDAIAPITTTKWNQEYPYNSLCPKVDGHETVTGCVATAMAQVMKYHNYPEHGKGKHSYFWKVGEEELSFNYDSIPFQWSLMDDVYNKDSSDEARHAVAELMLGCGISVDMHYSPGESGAATMKMGASLIDIFGYSKSLWMPNRQFYGYEEWEDMIYADLAEGLPVLYSGQGTAGGHQFICDGYQGDGYFHFNWGWGGLSNGYFLLTALNPDDLGVGGGAGGFNTDQIASLGVKPGKDGEKPVYLFYNTSSFGTEVNQVELGQPLDCEGQYFNFGLSSMPSGSHLGVKFTSESTEEVTYADGPSVEGYGPDYGRNGMQVRFPELSDGTYELTPALYVEGEWTPIRMPIGQPQMITAVVQNGVATLQNENAASIFVEDISVPDVIYKNHKFPMSFTVENIGDGEYYGKIIPVLVNSDGQAIAESTFRPMDVMTGEKETVSDYVGIFTAPNDSTFAAGTYTMVFVNESGRMISNPMEVTIAINTDTTKISIKDFVVEGGKTITDPAKTNISFNLSCESGVYFGSPRFVVFPGDGGYELYSSLSPDCYLTSSQSQNVTFDADMSELKDGWYIAMMYADGKSMTDEVYFHIDRTAGVDEMNVDSIKSEVYDLNGHRIIGNPMPGIYIVDGRKLVVR